MSKISAPHANPLASARVLVIGGTSGLGFAVASGALANGSKVHVSSSNPTRVTETESRLRSLYPSAAADAISGTAADLSDKETIEANIRRVLDAATRELGGPLDHIVYTAGETFKPGTLAELAAPAAFDQWAVRYLGPLMVGKLVAANPGVYLAQSAGSSISLTSGVMGRRPQKGRVPLLPITGAVESLSRGLAIELAPARVNVVLPGAVRTELMEKFGEEFINSFKEKSLVKEIGTPEAAAETYLYAMRSSFVTGQDLVVDGGLIYV